MSSTSISEPVWTVRGLDEFSSPGWFPVQAGLSPEENARWMREAEDALEAIVGVERWDGAVTTSDDLRELLARAFDEAQSVDAAATFQVWPLLGPVAVMCRVMLLTSDSVPKWKSTDAGSRHVIESKHLGVGLQFTARTRIESETGGADIEAVDLVFNDGIAAIVLTVEPTFAPVIANVLPGLQVLMDTIRVEGPDGTGFSGNAPDAVIADDSWEVETS